MSLTFLWAATEVHFDLKIDFILLSIKLLKRQIQPLICLRSQTHLLTADTRSASCFRTRFFYVVVIFYTKKVKRLRKEAVEAGPAVSEGLSRHTGAGGAGSGSLFLSHYVIRWAEFTLLVACEEGALCPDREKLKKLVPFLHDPPASLSIYTLKYSLSRCFTVFLIH